MFVLSITYTAPLDQIDALLPSHVAWLDAHYADGTFLASGRKVPRTGGVIIATADNRTAIEAVVAQDPFFRNQAATYEITEFVATKTSPALESHRQQP